MKQYSSIEELVLTLALYPTQKQAILEEAGKKFKLNGQDAWFVIAEDGNCALFNNNFELDDLSKINKISYQMILRDIKKINIPDSVKIIEPLAFSYCKFLVEVNMPDGIEKIKDNAFTNCISLIDVVIPDSMKTIEDLSFSRCTSLVRIIIPRSIKTIGEYAFFYCPSLEEVVFKGKTLEEVYLMKNYPFGIEDPSIIKAEK